MHRFMSTPLALGDDVDNFLVILWLFRTKENEIRLQEHDFLNFAYFWNCLTTTALLWPPEAVIWCHTAVTQVSMNFPIIKS